MGGKLSFERGRLKIVFEMKVTIFNQRMVFEKVNMTTKVILPSEKPNWEFCRCHGMMKVKKPGMAMVCILEIEGIKTCLLVIPVCI
jgi:hypothetical protein